MSGIEIVAAVSAVVSAFHGGSELLKQIKAKRRIKRQALIEFEEKELQNSLAEGYQQISLRYDQDVKEFGNAMRTGDAIARSRLQHITIVMQAEIIRSLQLAAQSERAILNLTLLREASITNKRDTIVVLNELKQRLSIQRTIPQQSKSMKQHQSNYQSSVAISPTVLPSMATMEQGPRPTESGDSRDDTFMMREIDHIIDYYQGLDLDHSSNINNGQTRWSQTVDGHLTDFAAVNPPNTTQGLHIRQKSTPDKLQGFPLGEQKFGLPKDRPYTGHRQTGYSPLRRAQGWKTSHKPSAKLHGQGFSTKPTPSMTRSSVVSLHRQGSTSLRSSQLQLSQNAHEHELYKGSPPAMQLAEDLYSQAEQNASSSIRSIYSDDINMPEFAALSSQRARAVPQRSPVPNPLSSSDNMFSEANNPSMGVLYTTSPRPQDTESYSGPDVAHAWLQPVSIRREMVGEVDLNNPRRHSLSFSDLRELSMPNSINSTNSAAPGPQKILMWRQSEDIRGDSIQSNLGPDKMVDGRPCRDNNYWGFCKGAWTIRENVKKGLILRTQPLGLYNTKELWSCKECMFQGPVFTAPHPTKKTVTIIDPRISTSQSGIRFRWIFLAKSHVKKSRQDHHTVESNYGCIICSAQGKVSSIYGGVETLMNHISLCHATDMSQKTMQKMACVIGPIVDGRESWELNIPAPTEATGYDG